MYDAIYEDMEDEYCPTCGNSMDWEDCWNCGGTGGRDGDELMEEDPLWYSPDDWEDCDICKGQGGWLVCYNNHPDLACAAPPPDAAHGDESEGE